MPLLFFSFTDHLIIIHQFMGDFHATKCAKWGCSNQAVENTTTLRLFGWGMTASSWSWRLFTRPQGSAAGRQSRGRSLVIGSRVVHLPWQPEGSSKKRGSAMLHWVAKSLLHEHGSNTLICTNRWSGRRNFYLFCVVSKWMSIWYFLNVM